MLLADVYFFSDKSNMPNHLSSLEAGRITREAKVKQLVLTHLPQFGDLEQLGEEGGDEAEGVPIDLATLHKTWDFNTF